eukprot:scaffold11613_cov72-Skeletonema_dohrnii-CCMP3373.AAC.1
MECTAYVGKRSEVLACVKIESGWRTRPLPLDLDGGGDSIDQAEESVDHRAEHERNHYCSVASLSKYHPSRSHQSKLFTSIPDIFSLIRPIELISGSFDRPFKEVECVNSPPVRITPTPHV